MTEAIVEVEVMHRKIPSDVATEGLIFAILLVGVLWFLLGLLEIWR